MSSFLYEHRYSAAVASFAALPFVFEKVYDSLHLPPQKLDFREVDVLTTTSDVNGKKKERIKLSREETRRPDIAWPTVLLAAGSFGAWLYNFRRYELSAKTAADKLRAVAVGSVATFVAFTPFHDSSHFSVSKYRWLNELVGTACGLTLGSPLPFFRYVHLMHHKHTNDHNSDLDPDSWAGRDPVWALPFRWATVIIYYIYWMRKTFKNTTDDVTEAQRRTLNKLKYQCLIGFGMILSAAITIAEKFGDTVLYCWLLPLQFASVYLMYVFDYLPHRPHKIPAKEDPYKATHILRGPFSVKDFDIILLFQNYHLIHHMWPSIPFYKMGNVFHNHEKEFMENGARVLPWYLSPNREKYLKELRRN